MNVAELPGLQIESSLVHPKAKNFCPTNWPPRNDFPVVIDASGNVVSRYSDVRWDLSPFAGHTLSIHFGDGPGKGEKLSSGNASLLRQIVAWWLWGAAAVRSTKSLVYKFESLKPLFVACDRNGILASDLYKYPKVIEDVANYYPSRGNRAISYLSELRLVEDLLGFKILDDAGMKVLCNVLPNPESTQTAYIPVRIWSYQVKRLKECLDDFLIHKDKIEDCYNFCLKAYAINAGGQLSNAFGGLRGNNPFRKSRVSGERKSGKIFHGSFQSIADKYEISLLLDRWVKTGEKIDLRTFSTYLSLISSAGLAYILNFSLMRIEEGSRLRVNCYSVEHDPLGADIHLLQGITTKTIQDNDAKWIVSPSVKVAVDAMTIVAKLRIRAAKENPYLELTKEDLETPLLQPLQHEPWSPKAPKSKSKTQYKKIRSYRNFLDLWPKLFDREQLMITESDMEMANRLTFGLDPEKFSVGRVWPIAWHQLRRTGAVNMLASGLVTEASLQYQLKHASRAMSQYYGKNFYRLKDPLSAETRGFYLREMYQSMVREFTALQSEQYISPHGEKRKDQVLTEISVKDHKGLLKAAKDGKLSYRETFLGGCANSGPPCPLGGISNISGCMGFGDQVPCKSAMVDRSKLPTIKKLQRVMLLQLKACDADSPLYESLQAQLESSERAINVIEYS